MNSKQRHEARYLRRRAHREEKRRNNCKMIGSIEEVLSFNELYKAGKACCKGVRWKQSVQNFEAHLLSETATRYKMVMSGKIHFDKYVHFLLNERGKTRPIDAPRVQDRQLHKAFTRNVLLPLYLKGMIWNNGASLRNKGFHFSMNMLRRDLHRHYRKYGRTGNVILIDFKQFFPTVSHEEIFKRHNYYLTDDKLRNFADAVVKSIPGDYGMPLGVEPSQAEMIALPSKLDSYMKCQERLKGFGHYMDDYYILVPPDRDPKTILKVFVEKAHELSLNISASKTRIIRLDRPFKYCKAKFYLTETGKVVVRGSRDAMKRDRRKIRAFKRKLATGEMTYEDLWTSTNGMLAYLGNYNDHNRVLKLRRLFYSLFHFSPEKIENFRQKENKNEVYST